MVIPAQFNTAAEFSEGLAVVSIGGKFGYIDKSGKFVINPQWDSALNFDKGVAEVWLTQPKYKKGYINKQGKYLWQPSE
jgi:hypothetical protein